MRTFLDREKSAEAEFSHVRSPAPRIASSTVFGAAIRRSKSSPGFLALTAVLPPTCFKKVSLHSGVFWVVVRRQMEFWGQFRL